MHPFDKKDGRHYNVRRINQWFALSSLLLLGAVLWVIVADHDREWKRYQRVFQELERTTLNAPPADAAAGSAEPQSEDPWEDGFWTEASSEAEPAGSPATMDAEAAPAENHARWSRRLANLLRDLPLLDFAAPTRTLDQIVVYDLPQDMNFAQAPRVDRCTTCHQGILRPEFVNAPQPFTTHPNLDLFLSSTSPHPLEQFGCTGCHGGRGRGTDFVSAAHTPADAAQEALWRTRYRWHPLEHEPGKMLPSPFAQASCFSCHSDRQDLPGAETLNQGLELIERAGCYGCHPLPARFEDLGTPGPSLRHLAAKTTPDWVRQWLDDPHAIRPGTWMPQFFGVAGERSAESEAEIEIITRYLFQRSAAGQREPLPLSGDAVRGRELLQTVGCLGCHIGPGEDLYDELSAPAYQRRQGPELAGLPEKTTAAWVFHWLKNPRAHDAGAKMPDLRLTDQEAADLVAHLMQPGTKTIKTRNPGSIAAALALVAPEYLGTSPGRSPGPQLAAMPLEEQIDLVGARLLRHYGCAGCHEIAGVEDALRIGAELTEVGGKSPHDLDFGPVDDIPHATYAWLMRKVHAPRAFQRAGAVAPQQRLRMPHYRFSDEELEAVTTALLGFVDGHVTQKLHEELGDGEQRIAAGRKLVRAHNCRGCHVMEATGGAIRPTIVEWLAASGDQAGDAHAIAGSFSPPNLIGEGKKVHAAWLFDYLGAPAPIRPWLKVRMPTYALTVAERNALIAYFSALDNEEFPFVAEADAIDSGPFHEAGKKLFSVDYFDCGNCHIEGDKFPSGSPDRWAPDFALSARRLKPDWVRAWLYNPQPLLPGTKMPTYFDPQYFDESGPDDILDGDEHQQIEALTNYFFTLGTGPAEVTSEPQAVPAPAEPEKTEKEDQ
jgi:cbb3-type cytochrome oxidase cytochrome c subunit/cytochrome c2